jgi:hypothetical protein
MALRVSGHRDEHAKILTQNADKCSEEFPAGLKWRIHPPGTKRVP